MMMKALPRTGSLVLLALTLAATTPATEMPPAVSEAEALKAGWPQWLGPGGHGAALDRGHTLVDDFAKAKLLWKSEWLPDGRASDGSDRVQDNVSGGFASPVVADGRVYFFYYTPSGNVHDAGFAARTDRTYSNRVTVDKWLISADDVVICLDAATGKTLWKQTFAGQGINWMAFNKGGPHLTPAVANGKVYALGTMGRLYALDAATGKPVWEGNIGKRFKEMEQLKQDCLETKRIPAFNRDMATHVCVADGVVLVNDGVRYKVIPPKNRGPGDGWVMHYEAENGALAFDGESGKQLWAKPQALAGSATRWVSGGKEFAVFSGHEKVLCVAPRTGEVLWEIAGRASGGAVSVGPQHLFCGEPFGEAKEARFVCYRISPAKAEKAWTLPAPHLYPKGQLPIVYRGHVYVLAGNRELLCVELETGKIVGKAPCKWGMGFGVAAEGRLFLQSDAGHIKPDVEVFSADPAGLRKLKDWSVPAAGCYTVPICHPIVDGQWYLRGHDGIYCYDLRQQGGGK